MRVVAGDMAPELSPACHLADVSVRLPRCTAPEYASELLQQCLLHDVRVVVPTIDTELRVMAENRKRFAEAGIWIAVSDLDTVELARDKAETARRLAAVGLSTPVTVSGEEFVADPARIQRPVIIKPRCGSSSIGVVRPKDDTEALVAVTRDPSAIVQELWHGREYTVNMFFDRAGVLQCAVPHLRLETRTGEVSKGRTENVSVLREAARKLCHATPGARAALCFQAIVNEAGAYAVIEINARFGGGYPLAHRAGARFTQWILEEALGLPSSAHDEWKPGVTMLRYDAAVFPES